MRYLFFPSLFFHFRIGHPVKSADEDGAADCVSEEDSGKIFDIVEPVEGSCKNSGWDDEHVCDDVLESDGDKCHDREPDAEDFSGDVVCGIREPDGETDEPVGTDGGHECFWEWFVDFTCGDLDRFFEIWACFGIADVMAEKIGDEDGADEVADGDDAPIFHDLICRDFVCESCGGKGHHVSGQKLAACDDDKDEAERENGCADERRHGPPDVEGKGGCDAYVQ